MTTTITTSSNHDDTNANCIVGNERRPDAFDRNPWRRVSLFHNLSFFFFAFAIFRLTSSNSILICDLVSRGRRVMRLGSRGKCRGGGPGGIVTQWSLSKSGSMCVCAVPGGVNTASRVVLGAMETLLCSMWIPLCSRLSISELQTCSHGDRDVRPQKIWTGSLSFSLTFLTIVHAVMVDQEDESRQRNYLWPAGWCLITIRAGLYTPLQIPQCTASAFPACRHCTTPENG